MKKLARSICLLAIPTLLLAFAGTTHAQEGAQPKTPPTPTQAILENWSDVGAQLADLGDQGLGLSHSTSISKADHLHGRSAINLPSAPGEPLAVPRQCRVDDSAFGNLRLTHG
jgi:hypothetical protein